MRKQKPVIISSAAELSGGPPVDLSGIEQYFERRFDLRARCSATDIPPTADMMKLAQQLNPEQAVEIAEPVVTALNNKLRRMGVKILNVISPDEALFKKWIFPQWLESLNGAVRARVWSPTPVPEAKEIGSEAGLMSFLREGQSMFRRMSYLVVASYSGELGARDITSRIRSVDISPSQLVILTKEALPPGLADETVRVDTTIDSEALSDMYILEEVAKEFRAQGIDPDTLQIVDPLDNSVTSGEGRLLDEVIPQFAQNISGMPKLQVGARMVGEALHAAYDKQTNTLDLAVLRKSFRQTLDDRTKNDAGTLRFFTEDEWVKPDDYIWYDPAAQRFATYLENIASKFPGHKIPPYLREKQGERAAKPESADPEVFEMAKELADKYPKSRLIKVFSNFLFFVGNPGVGKSILARVAPYILNDATGEHWRVAEAQFGRARDPYHGVTEARIRDLLDSIKNEHNLILLLDEFNMLVSDPALAERTSDISNLDARILAELQAFFENSKQRLIDNHILIIATGNVEHENRLPAALVSRGEVMRFTAPRDLESYKKLIEVEFRTASNGIPIQEALAYTSDEAKQYPAEYRKANWKEVGDQILDTVVREAFGLEEGATTTPVGMSPRDFRSAISEFVQESQRHASANPGAQGEMITNTQRLRESLRRWYEAALREEGRRRGVAYEPIVYSPQANAGTQVAPPSGRFEGLDIGE